MYLLEVQTGGGTHLLWKWFTAEQAGCAVGTACAATLSELAALANGAYQWRILDYGDYGYGSWTPFTSFTLNLTCYTLTTAVNPAGGGAVNATAPNCGVGYTAGTVVELTAVPAQGFMFTGWSGAAGGTANPVTVTMDGDKSVTANFRELAAVLISPSGTLNVWDYAFSWTGVTGGTYYLLEVQTGGGTQLMWKWFTAEQAGCAVGAACEATLPELAELANGDYRWRILDYGDYGYGSWSGYADFTVNLP